MAEKEKERYVKVKDMAGNEFVCPISALKDRKDLPEQELEDCVDDATVGRYAGNLDIVK